METLRGFPNLPALGCAQQFGIAMTSGAIIGQRGELLGSAERGPASTKMGSHRFEAGRIGNGAVFLTGDSVGLTMVRHGYVQRGTGNPQSTCRQKRSRPKSKVPNLPGRALADRYASFGDVGSRSFKCRRCPSVGGFNERDASCSYGLHEMPFRRFIRLGANFEQGQECLTNQSRHPQRIGHGSIAANLWSKRDST